jgi:thiol-disulfide isomerase/thioredoxin
MRRVLLPLFVLLSAATMVFAGTPTAAEVMTHARSEAKAQKKNILVKFEASWCGWCKRLDTFLSDPKMGKLMNDNFVIVHLVVSESEDKKDLENQGGDEMMTEWGGKGAGLPFMAVLSPDGKLIANSIEKKADGSKVGNTGYPAQPNEIAWFMTMLQKGSKMNQSQRGEIEAWLKEHAPR